MEHIDHELRTEKRVRLVTYIILLALISFWLFVLSSAV